MPRTLPWLNQSIAKNDAQAASSSPAPKRRKRDFSPEKPVDDDLNEIATPGQKERVERTPSTSPVPGPPAVEPMRPGYSADDIYVMVEDELHSTAKDYTQHIHYAEYVRLKKLARSRGERTLSAIEHGVDGRTKQSGNLQSRQERAEREGRKGDVWTTDSESESEALYMQDPQLAGLMTKERSLLGRDLAGMVKAKSQTRAAAGLSQSPHTAERHRDALVDEEQGREEQQAPKQRKATSKAVGVFEEVSEDEDDDLDMRAAAVRPSLKPPRKQNPRASSESGERFDSPALHKDARIFQKFAKPAEAQQRAEKSAAQPSVPVEDDKDLYDVSWPKPFKPTYKKAQKRQASHAASAQHVAPGRTPPRATGGENGTSPRPWLSSSSALSAKPASSPASSSAKRTAEPEQESRGRTAATTAFNDDVARRTAKQAQREKALQGRAKRVDDIPTFLF